MDKNLLLILVLGGIIVLAGVQAMEITEIQEDIASAPKITAAASAPARAAPAPSSGGSKLPSMVGGC